MTIEAPARVLRRAAEMLVRAYPEMTVRGLLLFTAVAANEGMTVTDYEHATGLPQTSVSRLLLDMSDVERSGGRPAGAGLLERHPDPGNLRCVRYRLSPKGRRMLLQIRQSLLEEQRRAAFAQEVAEPSPPAWTAEIPRRLRRPPQIDEAEDISRPSP